MDDEDLDALLGNAIREEQQEASIQPINAEMQALAPPAEDVKIDETLVQKIEQHTEDIICKSGTILHNVLTQLNAEPDNDHLITAAATYLNSHRNLVESLTKLYTATTKLKQQKEIEQMRIAAKVGMNEQNNETKLMMTREELFKELNKHKSQETIEI